MSNDGRYNGWSNYETWRVNLEVFDGYDPEGQWQTAESVETFVDECIYNVEGSGPMAGLVEGWARAFTADVDWQEIADHINEAYDLTDPDAEEEGQGRESYTDNQDRANYTA